MTDRPGPQKTADAYRTISEVAEELKLPQHVLRFWETRFPQVKPLKRAGGRRFYRPEDIDLLRAVKILLYGDGYTIRGVQRMLRERGARGLATLVAEGSIPPPQAADIADQDDATMRDESRQSDGPSAAESGWFQGLVSPHATIGPVEQPARPEPEVSAHSPRSDDVLEPPTAGDTAWAGTETVARLRAVLRDLAECEELLTAARLRPA